MFRSLKKILEQPCEFLKIYSYFFCLRWVEKIQGKNVATLIKFVKENLKCEIEKIACICTLLISSSLSQVFLMDFEQVQASDESG